MPASGRQRKWIIGIDLGGSHFSVGLVSTSGALQSVQRHRVAVADGPAAIIDQMREVIFAQLDSQGLTRTDVLAVGIGSPGPFDRKAGVIIESYNLQWFDVPLVKMLRERVGMDVVLDGDAISATYGEWWAGVGRGSRHMVGLTLGTGVGGGLIINGAVYYGCSDLAGHFGHMIIEANGRVCSCGNQGCLEAYASASAIVGRALEKPKELRRSQAWKEIAGESHRLTAKVLYQWARRGDGFARALFEETGRYLGTGLAGIIHTVNPEIIVVGGAVAKAGNLLLTPARQEAGRRAFKSAFRRTRIVRASLAENAGVIGAAGLAQCHFGNQRPGAM
ncbi:MAG: ROK family protein [Acidobacteria bacterium]|nr:ROK family protein [Acidobacteriota bacterium]MBI3655246.1 ROK family protein [Acidobacteriota bacterium]